MTDAFCVLDDELRWVAANTRSRALLHDLTGRATPPERLTGRRVANALPGFAGSNVEAQVRTAVLEARTAVLQLEVQGRWFRLHVSPIPGGATVAVRDVTAQRRDGTDRRRRHDRQTALVGLARQAVVGEPAALAETVARAIARALDADLVVVARDGEGGAALVEGRAGPEVAAAARLLGPDALGPTIDRATQDRDGPEVVVDPARLGPGVAGAVVVPLPVGPRRALVVATRLPRVFEREEIAFVALAADVLALAGARSTAIPDAPDGRPAGAVEREPSLRLLLVQDHAAMCEALSAALVAEDDVADVRRARSVAEARAAVDDVDVVLVDLALPGGGCELVGELRARNPDVGVLVLASDPEGPDAATAVERGAAGVLSSDTRLQDLVEAIRRVGRGETLLPVEEVVRMLRLAGRRREREQDDRRRLEALSPREREVLQLLASGVEHHDAATRLHVSPRTHRNHVANILSKLGVHSQLRAVLFAVRHGAVDVGDPDPDA